MELLLATSTCSGTPFCTVKLECQVYNDSFTFSFFLVRVSNPLILFLLLLYSFFERGNIEYQHFLCYFQLFLLNCEKVAEKERRRRKKKTPRISCKAWPDHFLFIFCQITRSVYIRKPFNNSLLYIRNLLYDKDIYI